MHNSGIFKASVFFFRENSTLRYAHMYPPRGAAVRGRRQLGPRRGEGVECGATLVCTTDSCIHNSSTYNQLKYTQL